MNAFAKLQQEDRRLTVLRVLAEVPGYSTNEYVLTSALRNLGHDVSRDLLRTELAWLSEQLAIETTENGGVTVAKVTTRGLDVAAGRTMVPGVKRPEPE